MIQIDVHERTVGNQRPVPAVGGQALKAGAKHQERIVGHRVGRVLEKVMPWPRAGRQAVTPKRQEMRFGEQALGLDGRHDGNGKAIDQVEEVLPALRFVGIEQGAAATIAEEDHRSLRREEFFQGFPGVTHVRALRNCPVVSGGVGEPDRVEALSGDVVWNTDVNGPGGQGQGLAQGLGEQGLKVLLGRHHGAVLGSVAIDGINVEVGIHAFLKVAAAEEHFRHLAGNGENRAVAVLSIHGAGEGVGGAGTGGHQDDAELARGTVITVGQKGRPAFVPADHVLDALPAVFQLVQRCASPPRLGFRRCD